VVAAAAAAAVVVAADLEDPLRPLQRLQRRPPRRLALV